MASLEKTDIHFTTGFDGACDWSLGIYPDRASDKKRIMAGIDIVHLHERSAIDIALGKHDPTVLEYSKSICTASQFNVLTSLSSGSTNYWYNGNPLNGGTRVSDAPSGMKNYHALLEADIAERYAWCKNASWLSVGGLGSPTFDSPTFDSSNTMKRSQIGGTVTPSGSRCYYFHKVLDNRTSPTHDTQILWYTPYMVGTKTFFPHFSDAISKEVVDAAVGRERFRLWGHFFTSSNDYGYAGKYIDTFVGKSTGGTVCWYPNVYDSGSRSDTTVDDMVSSILSDAGWPEGPSTSRSWANGDDYGEMTVFVERSLSESDFCYVKIKDKYLF